MAEGEAAAAPRKWARRRGTVRWSPALAARLCERLARGELFYEVCREPGMPTPQSVGRWARERPEFGERLAAARVAGGRYARAGGGVWTYCAETAEAIFERLCEGESLTAICRDPTMPCLSTVYYWRRRFGQFDEMLRLACEIRAERACDEGWELAMAATPETAYLTHVRLTQLRWMAGVMAPRVYRIKQVEPEAARERMSVLIRRFEIEVDPQTGERRVVAFSPNPVTGQVEREGGPSA